MERKTRMILGSAFLMMSGFLYTLERLNANIYWYAKIQTGSYPNNPETVALFSNLFVAVFFIIGICLIAKDFKAKSLD